MISAERMKTVDKMLALLAFVRGLAAFYELVKDHGRRRS